MLYLSSDDTLFPCEEEVRSVVVPRRAYIDLVITDIDMPVMSGNSVAKHIRGSAKSDTPIVGITGYAEEVDGQWFDVMLIKPISLEALVRVVESLT